MPAAEVLVRGLFLVVLVGGCSRTTESAWLEGFGYGWDNANHRLSYLSVGLVDGGAQVAVVGGASTTGRAFDEDGCLSSTCAEFAFTTDDAIVDVRWASASSDQVRFGAGAVDLVVSSAGAEAMIEVPLVAKGRGEVVAFLSGLTLDTSDSLPAEAADESCYDPRHGWHPREIRVALGEPVLADDGRTVTVPVEATFAAGASGEAVRACTDAVYDLAEVAMTVSVAVAVGEGAQHAHDVQLSKVYDYNGNQFNPPSSRRLPRPRSRPASSRRPRSAGGPSCTGGSTRRILTRRGPTCVR